MRIGDLIGTAVATYKLFTATEVLPALFWLALAAVFIFRFDQSLGWLGDIEDCLYDYEEENEPWEDQEQQSRHGNRRS